MRYGDNCSPRRAELRRAGVDVVVLERRESQGMAGSRGDISPHIHSAGSVAVLVNVETTPVQLHATLFPSGDPAGRGILRTWFFPWNSTPQNPSVAGNLLRY